MLESAGVTRLVGQRGPRFVVQSGHLPVVQVLCPGGACIGGNTDVSLPLSLLPFPLLQYQ